MATDIVWEGHRIHLESRYAGKYALLATETTISVDGKLMARSGGFGSTEKSICQFLHKDTTAILITEIKCTPFSFAKYKLSINGEEISQGDLNIERQVLSFLIIIFLLALPVAFCSPYILSFLFSGH
jgi:hypothetical protein